MRIVAAWGLATLLLAAGGPALAEPSDLELAREAHEISGSLMSPYCPGRTLADCPSPDAGVVRAEIRSRLERGESSADVVAGLRARFGDQLASSPDGPWPWVLPVALVVCGAGLLAFALRRLRRREQAPDAEVVPAEVERELEQALARDRSP